jgi:hypothetical protein
VPEIFGPSQADGRLASSRIAASPSKLTDSPERLSNRLKLLATAVKPHKTKNPKL